MLHWIECWWFIFSSTSWKILHCLTFNMKMHVVVRCSRRFYSNGRSQKSYALHGIKQCRRSKKSTSLYPHVESKNRMSCGILSCRKYGCREDMGLEVEDNLSLRTSIRLPLIYQSKPWFVYSCHADLGVAQLGWLAKFDNIS